MVHIDGHSPQYMKSLLDAAAMGSGELKILGGILNVLNQNIGNKILR